MSSKVSTASGENRSSEASTPGPWVEGVPQGGLSAPFSPQAQPALGKTWFLQRVGTQARCLLGQGTCLALWTGWVTCEAWADDCGLQM